MGKGKKNRKILGPLTDLARKKSEQMLDAGKRWAKQKTDKHNDAQAILEDMDSYPLEEQIAAVQYQKKYLNKSNPLVGCLCNPNGQAELILQDNLDDAIADATAALDPKDMWGTWMKLYQLMRAAENLDFHHLPSYQDARDQANALGLSMDDKMDLEKIQITDPRALGVIQSLFDSCSLDSVGGNDLPRLRVNTAFQVFHEQTRAEYLLKRQELVDDCDSNPSYPRVRVPSQQVSLANLFQGRHPVDPNYNEFYLFHGTTDANADRITDDDFLINTAADNGWTFGKGVYAAEYVSHAQLFAMINNEKRGEQGDTVTILVCRALCGRIQDGGQHPNTGTPAFNVSTLERNVENGGCHSTMGSEWPIGGYQVRDFILPDDDQILPEFIVNCSFA